MNQLRKQKTEERRKLRNLCREHNIDYDTLYVAVRSTGKFGRNSTELTNKLKDVYHDVVEYGTERMKLVKMENFGAYVVSDQHFLSKAIKYALLRDEGLDRELAKFVRMCYIHYDMFDLEDIKELAADINKRMNLGLKFDEGNYWQELNRTFASYQAGNYPKVEKKGISKVIENLTNTIDSAVENLPFKDKKRRADAIHMVFSDARECYPEDEEEFVDDFLLRRDCEVSILNRARGLVCCQRDGHYFICRESNGQVLMEHSDSFVIERFSQLSSEHSEYDIVSWVESRLAMVDIPEYWDDLNDPDDITGEPVAVQELPTSRHATITKFIDDYYVLDLGTGNKAVDPTTQREVTAEAQFVLMHNGAIMSTAGAYQTVCETMFAYLSATYGTPIDYANPNGIICFYKESIYLVINSKGIIVYATDNVQDAQQMLTVVQEGRLTDAYINNAIQADLGTCDSVALNAFMSKYAMAYKHPKLPRDVQGLVFCIKRCLAISYVGIS